MSLGATLVDGQARYASLGAEPDWARAAFRRLGAANEALLNRAIFEFHRTMCVAFVGLNFLRVGL